MDTNALIQIISNLGFPIAMCGALFWYINKQTELHKEEMHELRKEEMHELKQSIDNNTLVITKLYERLTDHEQ